MVSYHINPVTGNANQCRATKKCPFGDLEKDHYPTAADARVAYEKKMNAPLAETRGEDKGERGTEGVTVYDLLPGRKDEAIKSIDKANRRLEKFGIVDRFEYTLEEKHRVHKVNGVDLGEKYYELTLNAPTIGLEGHRFLAVVTEEDGGLITRTGKDVELRGWRPSSMLCEHCGQKRPRSKTYLVQGPDGKRHQIGSSCVQAYLGVKPEGLWALGYNPVDTLAPEERSMGGGSASSYSRPVRETVAYALAVSNGAVNFTSKSAAMEYDRSSTAGDVDSAIFGIDKASAGWRAEMAAEAQRYLEDGTADKVLKHIQNIEGMNDYAVNVRTISSGEWVSPRNSALLISGLASYRRTLEIEAKAKAVPFAEGFAGHIKERLRDRKVKIEAVTYSASINDRTGADETITRVVMRDENDHQLLWWTTTDVQVEQGQDVTLKAGTVSRHSNFKGSDQTVVNRVVFEEAPESS